MLRYYLQPLVDYAVNQNVRRVAEPSSVLGNDSKHRLNIRRRAGNDTENFARRSLLLQRFLQLVEQPNVLDGNDRLISKGFHQLNLTFGKRLDDLAPYNDTANWRAFSE